ncbi:TPA: hypothetical protein JWK76_002588 [Escherichia coli]|uniref:hypothetical protein n=3 Tax=Escherichia TaxID=561 RepID=UPI0005B627FC|nr:hypothetical protein [Escherichia coli]EFA4129941.1 hypothetical protein [Escherichia coli O13]EEQ6524472.1 hypothetical protein [Escherichia coli]EEQ9687119.1 hypothetical protein [Escherichia coli]EEQ9773717.1 hypothetical protein [Escherichia coli]EES3798087.1 hypothetical protein [Escherichia coli]
MKTFICTASGPSLSAEDCRFIADCGLPVIAVNSTWKRVPFATHVFACDFSWWKACVRHITIPAQRWTDSRAAHKRFGINFFPEERGSPVNSGRRAIEFALWLGAERVILLGYDCSVSRGTHWHGDHPEGLKNPTENSTRLWRSEFEKHAPVLNARAEIINCSVETALTCFPRRRLREVLDATVKKSPRVC